MSHALANSPLARFAIGIRDSVKDGVGSYIDHWRWDPWDAAAETGIKTLIAGVAGAVIVGGAAMTMSAYDYANRVDLSGPDVVAEMSVGQMYEGRIAATDGSIAARDGTIIRIDGDRLESGTTYRLDGHLIIEGSTPQDCDIRVNGPVTVTGDVGEACSISAKLPTAQEAVHGLSVVPMGKTMMTVPSVTYNDTGLLFPGDTKPGIEVAGHVAAGASLSTNGGISVGSHDATATLDTGYGALTVTGMTVTYGDGPAEEVQPDGPQDTASAPRLN